MRSIATVAAMCVLCFPGREACGEVIAQFDYFSSGGSSFSSPFYQNYHIMQTFVPTNSGVLQSIDVTIHQSQSSTTQTLSAAIYNLTTVWPNGLQPTGAPLATGSLAHDDPQFDTFFITWKNISMTPVELQAGQTYGLVIDAGLTTSSEYCWYSKSGGDLYPSGNMAIESGTGTYAQQNYDMPFRINAETEIRVGINGFQRDSGGACVMRWEGNRPGLEYAVEACTNFIAGDWMLVGPGTPWIQGTAWTNNGPEEASMFFRVRAQ